MKKLTLFYDNGAFIQSIGGVSRCFVENFKYLDKNINIKLFTPFSNNIYLKEYRPKIKSFFANRTFKGKTKLQLLLNNITSIIGVITYKYDIIHITAEGAYLLPFIKYKPVVITIHDLIPEDLGIRNRIKNRAALIKRADHIVAVSEYTKQRLLYYYPFLNPDNITVVYHGFDNAKYQCKDIIKDDYILYVGGRSGYKNFELFIKAVAPILTEKRMKLVCTGSPFSKAELELMNSLGIEPSKVIQMFVDENTLYSLYKFAKVFVYPSIAEGFGIPLLEAWSQGCPICISNASCFPEIAQDGAIYFDPNDIDDMREKIVSIIDDDFNREYLINLGYKKLCQYSWSCSAGKLLNIYESLTRKNNK